MSYIADTLRGQFESLPMELKNEILSRNVELHTMSDLIAVLEQIAGQSS